MNFLKSSYKLVVRAGSRAMAAEERIPGRIKIASLLLLIAASIAAIAWYLQDKNIAVLNPGGTIASEQRNLLYFGVMLSTIIVIPVFVMAITIYSKYKESNSRAKYQPDWDHNRLFEAVWWLVPLALIAVLSVITWTSSHRLDPYRPISSTSKEMNIEVISLDWKWLFIYPDYGVATVNHVNLPIDVPVDFKITSDAPMNSFWIPQLGGQVYAMSGMTTHLNLIATELGEFNGVSANISGEGFAGMKFVARSVSQQDFDEWIDDIKQKSPKLNYDTYNVIALPSQDEPEASYAITDNSIYDKVIMKYMLTQAGHEANARGVGGMYE